MKGLKEQIQKGTLGNLYLFYGVERFLVQLYEQRMRKAYVGAGRRNDESGCNGKSRLMRI